MDIKIYLPDELVAKFIEIPRGYRSTIMQMAFKEFLDKHDIKKIIKELEK